MSGITGGNEGQRSSLTVASLGVEYSSIDTSSFVHVSFNFSPKFPLKILFNPSPSPPEENPKMTTQIPSTNPYAYPHDSSLSPSTTALLIIDMQRDFLSPGGVSATFQESKWPLEGIALIEHLQRAVPLLAKLLPNPLPSPNPAPRLPPLDLPPRRLPHLPHARGPLAPPSHR